MTCPYYPGKPLTGHKVVVTRAADQAGGFADMLRDAGAEVVEFPTIETVPPVSWDELDKAIASNPEAFALPDDVRARMAAEMEELRQTNPELFK